jgi:predicted phosphodiesterase
MRLQLLSDLHLERYPDFLPAAAPDADVLVLAGDIGSYQTGSRLGEDDFGLSRFSPRAPGAPWRQVLFVPGNHEYDGLEFEPTRVRLRALCERLGITWLDREVRVVDGVRFVGTTLWADFDALAVSETTLADQLRQREKAFRAANFYLSKNTTLQDGRPVLAEGIRAMAVDCRAWLAGVLAEPFDGPTVVVTHFAPSLRSADPRYGVSPGTAGFCNSYDDLLPHVQLWLHGHLHCPHDYVVDGHAAGQPWACRVVTNPRGYYSKGEQATFREGFVIEVGGR